MSRPFAQALFFLILLFAIPAMGANESMQSFTLSGPVYQAGTTAPLLDSNLIIKVQILNPAKTCVLYEEQQTFDTSVTSGVFNIQVGSAYPNAKRTANDPGNSMARVYQNMSAITGTNVTGQTCGGSYTPTAGATRYFRVTFTPSSTGVPDTMNPDIAMGSVPSALVAQSLQGLERANVLQTRSDANYSLTQANLEALLSTTNFPRLLTLASGSSAQYLPAMPSSPVSWNSQRLSNLADPTSAQDAVTKAYADGNMGGKSLDVSGVGAGVGNGRVLTWDAALNKWMASALSLDTGTGANKLVQLNASGILPALDGSNLRNINTSLLQSRLVSSAAPASGQVLGWNGSLWMPMTIQTSSGTSSVGTGNEFLNGGNEFGAAAALGTNDAYSLTLETAGAARMFIANNGLVGIGTTTPQAALDVQGSGTTSSAIVVPRDSTAARPVVSVNGMLRYNSTIGKMEFFENGAWVSYTISSDERLKKNVVSIENGLEMVEKIRPVYFDWDFSNPKAQGYADKHQVGFIAQELEKILPEVVNQGGDSYRTVEYAKIVPVAIAAVKDLNGQVKALRQENADLKARLDAQSRDMDEIKKRLGIP